MYLRKTSDILLSDTLRASCLRALKVCDLPQGYIGAGFVRNAIWDYLHQKAVPTPLNDVDVVYFDSSDMSTKSEQRICNELSSRVPGVTWQVKNQARMHSKHGHLPYTSTEQAISHWVEKETCVAVRLSASDTCDVIAPFGLASNFANTITLNSPSKSAQVFIDRIVSKRWQTHWPHLQVQGIALSSSLR